MRIAFVLFMLLVGFLVTAGPGRHKNTTPPPTNPSVYPKTGRDRYPGLPKEAYPHNPRCRPR